MSSFDSFGGKDFYSVLEVPRDADDEAIKKSYRKLAKTYHPDKNKSEDAEAKFHMVSEAYKVLSNPEERRTYDAIYDLSRGAFNLFASTAPPQSYATSNGHFSNNQNTHSSNFNHFHHQQRYRGTAGGGTNGYPQDPNNSRHQPPYGFDYAYRSHFEVRSNPAYQDPTNGGGPIFNNFTSQGGHQQNGSHRHASGGGNGVSADPYTFSSSNPPHHRGYHTGGHPVHFTHRQGDYPDPTSGGYSHGFGAGIATERTNPLYEHGSTFSQSGPYSSRENGYPQGSMNENWTEANPSSARTFTKFSSHPNADGVPNGTPTGNGYIPSTSKHHRNGTIPTHEPASSDRKSSHNKPPKANGGDSNSDEGLKKDQKDGDAPASKKKSSRRRENVTEVSLPCTLEELFAGFSKLVEMSKDVEDEEGKLSQVPISFTIDGQPGWKVGTRIAFAGAGSVKFGQAPMDVEFVIAEKPHPMFTRQGSNLYYAINKTLSQAPFGHFELFEGIDGRSLEINLTHINLDTVVVMKGEGMPSKDGSRGDLIVTFQIDDLDSVSPERIGPYVRGPLDWRSVSLKCTNCHRDFIEAENDAHACWLHPGSLVGDDNIKVFSQNDQVQVSQSRRVYSCCGGKIDSSGCFGSGPHVCSEEAKAAAEVKAANNGLFAAAMLGDPELCAYFIVQANFPLDLTKAATTAYSSRNFFALLYFVLLGVDLSSLGETHSVLEIAGKGDKNLFTHTLLALDGMHAAHLDSLAKVEDAAPVVFALACVNEEIDVVRELLKHPLFGPLNCGLDEKRSMISKLLGWCGTIGDLDCATVLLECGANVDWVDAANGMTALHHAVCNNNLQFVAFLLDCGARSAIRDKDGKRPVDLAIAMRNDAIVETLEYAMFEEALTSMAGLTVVRIVKDFVGGVTISETEEDLRSGILVLEDALRALCELSDVFDISCAGNLDPTFMEGVLDRFFKWAAIDETQVSLREHIAIGKETLTSLLTAGVMVKAHLQEQLSDLNTSISEEFA